jgi:membrane protease YdiL (CAAX protease family)
MFSVLVAAAVVIVSLAIGTTAFIVAPDLSSVGVGMAVNVGLAVLAAVLLTRLGWWARAGFTGPRRWHQMHLVLPLVAVVLSSAVVQGRWMIDLPTALVVVGLMLVVGFAEEALFRGVILEALRVRGTFAAVVGSTLLFAALHAMNAVTGEGVVVIVQILTAVGIGLAFAAVRLRTGSLVPLIGIHAAINFVGYAATNGDALNAPVGPVPLGVELGLAALMAVYGTLLIVRMPRAGAVTERGLVAGAGTPV